MDRFGLGYEALSAINPGLIYCSISGFGMTGPLRDRPSFDIVLQALSGALSVNGEPGVPPTKLGIPLGDLVGGINGPIAILAALHERGPHGARAADRHQPSRRHDRPARLSGATRLLHRRGSQAARLPASEPRSLRHLPRQRRQIIIACLTNSFWARICEALGQPDWMADTRFDMIEKRRDNRELVNAMISDITRHKSVDEMVDLFTRYQVPHAPILGIHEALAQPQAASREMVVEVDHPTMGKIPIVGRPIKFPGAEQPAPAAPPIMGQHTDEILSVILGLAPERIEELRASKAVA
jgi:crotonobetainyl-CoA:carnitine CoA-transferase CaiB-like acyl-CoA transferase